MLELVAIVGLDTVQGWMEAGGYLVILLVLCACGLGLPLPEDIPLILAGAFSARGKMDLATASVCCWVGIIGGDSILYYLSRKYGMGVTRLPLIGRHITPARVERVEMLFVRYGIWVVAFCRLFAGLRAGMVVAAGVTRFNFVKFVIADGIAALISGGLFIALGYWFGTRLEWLLGEIKAWQNVLLLGGLVLGLGFGAYFLWTRRRRRPAQAEQPSRELVGVDDGRNGA